MEKENESSVSWSQKWWTSKSRNVNFYFSYFCIFVLLRFLMSLQVRTPWRPHSRFHFLLKQEKLTSIIIEIISAFLSYSFMDAICLFSFFFFVGNIRIKMTFGSHNRCKKIFLRCKSFQRYRRRLVPCISLEDRQWFCYEHIHSV